MALSVFCFTAFCNIVIAEKKVLLDMAPDAVDDLYMGCTKEALDKFVHSGLFREELNSSEAFQTTTTQCSKVIPGGLKEHTVALLAFLNGGANFRETLNSAVYSSAANISTYINSFHFKSFHFLLMDSIKLLNKSCETVYAFSDTKFKAHTGSNVRFGRFYSGYSFDTIAEEDLDDGVILNITTCFSAHLGDNICSKEETILLSPAEVFAVEDVRTMTKESDESYTMIVLKHSTVNSMHNCQIFSRSPADTASHWLVLALLASFYITS